jgi:hypothetical protein
VRGVDSENYRQTSIRTGGLSSHKAAEGGERCSPIPPFPISKAS